MHEIVLKLNEIFSGRIKRWRIFYVSGTELLPETSEFCLRESLKSLYRHIKQLQVSANNKAIDMDVKYRGFIKKYQMKL